LIAEERLAIQHEGQLGLPAQVRHGGEVVRGARAKERIVERARQAARLAEVPLRQLQLAALEVQRTEEVGAAHAAIGVRTHGELLERQRGEPLGGVEIADAHRGGGRQQLRLRTPGCRRVLDALMLLQRLAEAAGRKQRPKRREQRVRGGLGGLVHVIVSTRWRTG
jgi:hypothetical protein